MWKDTETVNGLNRSNIFQGVYYARSVNSLSYKEFNQFLGTTQIAIDNLATIKYNPAYCQFLSKEMDYDFARGFHNLQKTPLVLDILMQEQKEIRAFTYGEQGDYLFSLQTTKSLLNAVTDFNLSTIIGHEFGHHLIFGSENSQNTDQALNEPFIRYRHFKENWQEEFNADKISIASNSENDFMLASIVKVAKKGKINHAYVSGLLPEFIAHGLSDFCMVRNEKLLNITQKYGERLNDKQKRIVDKTLDFLNIGLATTHPPDISRTIQGEKFAKKCVNFLKNPKA